MFKLLTACALLGVAAAQYAPAPVYKQEKLAPQPYAYEYGVADDYSKANFKKAETQDAYGNVAGSFTIALPDGRLQTTTYTADHENGFVAEVTYSGTAQYPPEPAAGYGHAAPHAAPAYRPVTYAG
eukprot:TRINITY_DN166_c0_g1_i14.p2 TRINITY_DN166_c0_g1~~TRINITY_DN166_c0_g1_i14.p2  ORF type:complete len:126 (-),score=50.82 TRINITY_DN166_c0_g1_i14:41-418(-)